MVGQMDMWMPSMAGLTPVTAAAALDEMKFWVRIMFEHSKFIRGGLDPSRQQEPIFRTADSFAMTFDRLEAMVNRAVPGDIGTVRQLMEEVIPPTIALRNFKAELFQALSECSAVAELPAALLDHIRREADFFLNNLYIILGRPAAPREVLGIPNGEIPAHVLPRLLIPYTGDDILAVARDENLFHLRIQEEHGEVLLLVAYRPKIQDMLYRETAIFEKKLERLRAEARRVPMEPTSILRFNEKVRDVMVCWHDFLKGVHHDVVHCNVPSGQINTPALLLDHMAREVEYYISVLDIVGKTITGRHHTM